MNRATTIFCELTPPGRGGISTLAVMGPDADAAVGGVFQSRRGGRPEVGRLQYGLIISASGETLDEVIVRGAMDRSAPPGATEIEIHCHGGPAAVQAVGRRLAEGGATAVAWADYLAARAARQGQSRIVLESELLLPNLATLPAVMLVISQRNGLLAEAVSRVDSLLSSRRAGRAVKALAGLLAAYETSGRWIEQPPRVAILGRANVGKSSLLNRLAGRERAIVAETPGTTRDVVTEQSELGGLPVVLADTAGIRPPGDVVEQLGIERARAESLRADVLLQLVDLSQPGQAEERTSEAGRFECSLVVGTKADAAAGAAEACGVDVATSSVTGQGVAELTERILAALGFRWPDQGEATPFTRRQAGLLAKAKQAAAEDRLDTARECLAELLAPPSVA